MTGKWKKITQDFAPQTVRESADVMAKPIAMSVWQIVKVYLLFRTNHVNNTKIWVLLHEIDINNFGSI